MEEDVAEVFSCKLLNKNMYSRALFKGVKHEQKLKHYFLKFTFNNKKW